MKSLECGTINVIIFHHELTVYTCMRMYNMNNKQISNYVFLTIQLKLPQKCPVQ